MAAPTKPEHFLIAILFYALTWIVVSYVFSLLGHRFGWSFWANERFSLGKTVLMAMFWSFGMVLVRFLARSK